MSTITRERLEKIARGGGFDFKEVEELARIALASLEAEPVAYMHRSGQVVTREECCDDKTFAICCKVETPLYTAPPTPVSVPDELSREEYKRRFMEEDEFDDTFRGGWNACRAAMLQGAEPVTTACKLPANTPCKDAPEHIWLQTAGIWPENGEFSELTWCSDNQHPDDTLYVRADVVAGNSPVIPDGWKLVPIELTGDMTNAMSEAILDDLHNVDVWRSVLAAAPQQEVK